LDVGYSTAALGPTRVNGTATIWDQAQRGCWVEASSLLLLLCMTVDLRGLLAQSIAALRITCFLAVFTTASSCLQSAERDEGNPSALATSPYAASSIIGQVVFDGSSHRCRAPGSDNWPVTWADDENQYAAWGQGHIEPSTFPMGYQPAESSESNLAIRQYCRFASRYGEFLYDLNWRRAQPDMVDVKAPNNVFWRELVFQRRTRTNAKQVVMHLINWDGSPRTAMILGRHALPDPLQDIQASVQWAPRNIGPSVGLFRRWRPDATPASCQPNRRDAPFHRSLTGLLDDRCHNGSGRSIAAVEYVCYLETRKP